MTFLHRAGVTTYTSDCSFADGCVFGKQSPGPAFCRSLSFQTGAALLPKLRAHFAEFLNASSPEHLGLLTPPTCVGFRYGPVPHVLRRFSRCRMPLPSLARRLAPPRIASERLLARSSTALLRDGDPSPRAMHAARPAFAPVPGRGIFATLPSATALALALGSDFPGADCPCPGDLRFSVGGDLTRLFVTYACILSPASSSRPHGPAFMGQQDAPLPVRTVRCRIPGFGATLSPATLSARGCSTSELLRTLSRNGCF